jgi:DNA-binding CsgD family transcriptional regulator
MAAMDEVVLVSTLIGSIYDASLDPTLWPQVLQRIAEFVGGPAAALYSKDSVRKTGNVFYQSGVESQFIQSYFDKYVRLDPFTTTRYFFPVEHVISTKDIMRHEEFYQTTFYKEWAQPQGWSDFVSASLEKSATVYSECGIFWHERAGITTEDACRKMSLLIGHVRRAVTISKVIDLHKVEAAELADTLDGLASAMILVDAAGRIVHANAVGHTMLADGTPVRASGGKLVAADPAADRALRAIFANAKVGDSAVGMTGVAVPLSAPNGERYIAHVLPLTSGARRKAIVAYSAIAAIFIRKAALEVPHPLEVLASTYKLTPAEMRVLMMIVDVGGVPEVAPVLGVSETTVKSHLQRIFAKTASVRQADLVKLVASYTGPFG